MRKIISITQLTVDGVMQSPGGPNEDPANGFAYGGWVAPHFDDVAGEVALETISGDFDMLLGRRTYDIFANYWPRHGDSPIGKAFNKATKYVITHRPEQLRWEKSVGITGDIVDKVRRLKTSDGPALHVWGSSEVLQTLMGADLVDEYRLWIFPALVGGGKRLFQNGVPPRGLALISTQSTPKGVVFNTYRLAGDLPTASVHAEEEAGS